MPEPKLGTLDTSSGNLFKYDGPAGTVVFLVALPLCLGIALASGAPLFSGVIAGIVGGIVVATLSGSHVSVSGPAAGLTVIVATAISTLGSYQAFLLAVVLAGAIQILLGLFRLGNIADYVPNSVIRGMLAAIGILIILKQIPHALGRDKDYEGNFAFFGGQSNSLTDILQAILSAHPGAIVVSTLGLAILFGWDHLTPASPASSPSSPPPCSPSPPASHPINSSPSPPPPSISATPNTSSPSPSPPPPPTSSPSSPSPTSPSTPTPTSGPSPSPSPSSPASKPSSPSKPPTASTPTNASLPPTANSSPRASATSAPASSAASPSPASSSAPPPTSTRAAAPG